MCVTDYPAADEVLGAPGVLDALAGRTFVQLSNGNEEQARAQQARVRAAGARVLTGGILGYPRHIGRPETVIMYAGDAGAFEEHAATLADLAGAHRYYGEDPGPPNAVYVAAFGFYFAALTGFLEAAALAESRGVPPGEFAAAMPGMAALLLDHIDDAARRIEEDDFAGDQATVDVHLVGSLRRQRTLEDAGLGSLMNAAYRGVLPSCGGGGGGRRGHRRPVQADAAGAGRLIAGPAAARLRRQRCRRPCATPVVPPGKEEGGGASGPRPPAVVLRRHGPPRRPRPWKPQSPSAFEPSVTMPSLVFGVKSGMRGK